jgi:GTP cyclohydrolase I
MNKKNFDSLSVDYATTRLLYGIEGLSETDTLREGLTDTPTRVSKAWGFWTSGYRKEAETIVKVFADGAENVDEMIIEVDIPFYSHCEHHLAPFFGLASVAYIPQAGPDGRVLGLSKMNRLVDMFARRLQVQERLTNQIADAMEQFVQPLGCGVHIRARHMCVESRGVEHRGCSTITNALRGVIKTQPDTRAEFMAMAKTNTHI